MDEDDEADDERECVWTIEHFKYGAMDSTAVASESDMRHVVDEYHRFWFNDPPPPDKVGEWLWEKMNIPIQNGMNWQSIDACVSKEGVRLAKIRGHCEFLNIYDGEIATNDITIYFAKNLQVGLFQDLTYDFGADPSLDSF